MRALALLWAALALSLLALGAQGTVAPAPAFAQGGCPAQPAGLAPEGPGPTRFTMMIRINQQANVNTYANFNSATGGLGGYIRPQDIFVINTRFETTTPAIAASLATNLRAAFPCNRIIGLNGMSFNPLAPGYAFSLIDHPDVFALMTDYEPGDWNAGRATDPGRPAWSANWGTNFKKGFPPIKGWNGRFSGSLSTNPTGAQKRLGLVPINYQAWDYGQIAQDLDKKSRRLGGTKLGLQSIQSQDPCADGGATAFSARVKQLLDQYKFRTVFKTKVIKKKGKKFKKRVKIRRKIKPAGRPLLTNLALQISFSDTPNPNAGMAITKTSAATAAQCAQAGLKRGGGAFFFFASDDSMRLLFKQPFFLGLRASASGGKTGGVSPK